MKKIVAIASILICFQSIGQPDQNKLHPDSSIIFIEKLETLVNQLAQFKGSVVYIDFWATFCSPCIKQFKFKNELNNYFERNDIVSLCICVDKEINRERWKSIVIKHSVHGYHVFISSDIIDPYKSGIRISEKFFNLLGKGFPHFLITDKEGKIVEEYAELPEYRENLIYQLERYNH